MYLQISTKELPTGILVLTIINFKKQINELILNRYQDLANRREKKRN